MGLGLSPNLVCTEPEMQLFGSVLGHIDPPGTKESGEDHHPSMGRRGVGWNRLVVCSPYLQWGWSLCCAGCGRRSPGFAWCFRLQKWIPKGSKPEPGMTGRERSIEASDAGCLYAALETVWAVCSIFLRSRCFVWKVVDTCQR